MAVFFWNVTVGLGGTVIHVASKAHFSNERMESPCLQACCEKKGRRMGLPSCKLDSGNCVLSGFLPRPSSEHKVYVVDLLCFQTLVEKQAGKKALKIYISSCSNILLLTHIPEHVPQNLSLRR